MPSQVTVVGIPAKVVRVHGKKDELVNHQIEEERKERYYISKLEEARYASMDSSHL
ncbi:Uncharacterised protein [Chlamydia trachomatis]|nr:Uncharacterised protein [Chlamydia trachomatis]